jgi:hypothetical protein
MTHRAIERRFSGALPTSNYLRMGSFQVGNSGLWFVGCQTGHTYVDHFLTGVILVAESLPAG